MLSETLEYYNRNDGDGTINELIINVFVYNYKTIVGYIILVIRIRIYHNLISFEF